MASSLPLAGPLQPGPRQPCAESLSHACCTMLSPGSSPLFRSFMRCGAAPPVLHPASCSCTIGVGTFPSCPGFELGACERRLVQAECEPHADNPCYPNSPHISNQGSIVAVASLPLAEASVVCPRRAMAWPACDGTQPGAERSAQLCSCPSFSGRGLYKPGFFSVSTQLSALGLGADCAAVPETQRGRCR